jgi:hypothetical protein
VRNCGDSQKLPTSTILCPPFLRSVFSFTSRAFAQFAIASVVMLVSWWDLAVPLAIRLCELKVLQMWLSSFDGLSHAGKNWMSPSKFHRAGVRFDNGYQSERLAHILQSAMQHQTVFSIPQGVGRQGFLQISTPTQQESVVASALVNETLHHLGSPAELAPA